MGGKDFWRDIGGQPDARRRDFLDTLGLEAAMTK